MKTLIVGSDGEVGRALMEVLKVYRPSGIDNRYPHYYSEQPDIMHVCFPYSEKFIDEVKTYQEKYKPKYTIIHSTVPMGTSRKCTALHSPIRGIHPQLADGIKQFVKFIGGEEASEVADYFRKANLRVMLFDKSETTEAMKLWDTQYYLECIRFAQRVKRYCDKHGLNYSDVYRLPNRDYNESYTILGHPEFVRPILEPIMTDKIGGHCLSPNEELLKLSE